MIPSSLNVLGKFTSIQKIVEEARKYSEDHDLVPLITFYLEDELLTNLIKTLDSEFSEIYREYGYEKTLFLKKLAERFNYKNSIQEFPYYLIPVGDKSTIQIAENNKVPPKAIPISGTFRLAFMPYRSIEELNNAISKGLEDDIILEFKNGKQISIEKKRNIFMDFRSVEKIQESIFSANFVPTTRFTLIATIIANNVKPLQNEIIVIREKDSITFEIKSGKATHDEVTGGNTLTLREKGNVYYDYKKKAITREELAKSIAWKLSQ